MAQLKARKMFVAKHGTIPSGSCCKEVRELSSLIEACFERMGEVSGSCFARACGERYGPDFRGVAVCRHRYGELMKRAKALHAVYTEANSFRREDE